MYICPSQTPNLSLSHSCPLEIVSSFSKSVNLFLFGKQVHLYPWYVYRLSSPGSPLTSPITGIECLLSHPSNISVANTHNSLRSVSSVESHSLWPHGLQHTRFPCPSPVPGACSHLTAIKSVMSSNHLILCYHLLLPSVFPSIRVFSSESVLCIRWPKYCSFSINPSNEYSGLISFRIDWFDLLAVQGTLKSLVQHHSSKASVLQWSAFFVIQLSHPYMTAGKTIALTRQTFVGTVMSLLFNMLSRFVIDFFFKEHASFDFMAAVTICSDFGAQENESLSQFPLFPHLFAMKWWDQMPWILIHLVFWMFSFKPANAVCFGVLISH